MKYTFEDFTNSPSILQLFLNTIAERRFGSQTPRATPMTDTSMGLKSISSSSSFSSDVGSWRAAELRAPTFVERHPHEHHVDYVDHVRLEVAEEVAVRPDVGHQHQHVRNQTVRYPKQEDQSRVLPARY